MAMNITRVLLQHSPNPDERPLRLDGMSGAMPESVFMAPGDSVRAGLRGAATMPPRSVWRCWVGAMECRLTSTACVCHLTKIGLMQAIITDCVCHCANIWLLV